LRFTKTTPKGTTVTAASNTALPKSNFDTYRSTDDVELNLTEKTVAVGDEEAQSHEMPGLRSRDGR
jgi:hypothetical protein